ncbi:MAG TPA: MmcQ/YjbR family DNA-binding protein [Luteibaculaceae bacterium]|jgi:predicted DNA-binding protein (MmcQ/YjbR family)|nr:MmcQ/YjbR family DNA-binding protein [Luteibaculaceae bacterium]
MNAEDIRAYCLSKPGVEEGFPFDGSTLVFKVGGKMFALFDVDQFSGVNLKCDPEWAVELRERYAGVTPGYHMNKQHWNTVVIDGSFSSADLIKWIDHSYDLVFRSLPKKQQLLISAV